MSGNDVNLTFTASERGMDAVFAKMMSALDKSMTKMDQLGTASEKVNRQKFDSHVKELEKATAAAEKLRLVEERQAQSMAQRSRFNQVASSERLAALRRNEAADAERQERLSTGRSRFQQIATSERLAARRRGAGDQFESGVRDALAARGVELRRDAEMQKSNAARESEIAQLGRTAVGLYLAEKAFSVATQAVERLAQRQRDLHLEQEQAGLSGDVLQRRFMVQANLGEAEGFAARQNIIRTAGSNAADVNETFRLATQLESSGFTRPDQSGVLDVVLKTLAASNMETSEGVDVAKAAGQFLVGFGKDKNAQNLLDLAVRTRGIGGPTEMNFGDLTEFAQAAPTFKQANIPLETTMSTFGILREQMSAAEAATSARNVVGRMQSFESSDVKTSVLERMGLKPEDVDIVGESLPEALVRLKKGIESLPESERAGAGKVLFEEQARGAFITLSDAAATGGYERMAGLQKNMDDYQQGVNIAQSGPNAVKRRLEAQKALQLVQGEQAAINEGLARQVKEQTNDEFLRDSMRKGGAWEATKRAVVVAMEAGERKLVDLGGMKESDTLTAGEKARVDRLGKSNFDLPMAERDLRFKQREADIEKRRQAEVAAGGNQAAIATRFGAERGAAFLDVYGLTESEAATGGLTAERVREAERRRRAGGPGPVAAPVDANGRENADILRKIETNTAPRPAPAAHVPVAASARSRT